MRRQMSEGRPGGNVRKKKKDNLNNRMALVGVTMVVLSLAVAQMVNVVGGAKAVAQVVQIVHRGEGKSGGAGCERRRTCQTA